MSTCGRLIRGLLGKRGDRSEHAEQARTDDLIDEAERTRRELARLTGRLAAHVIALKALTAAYARQHQEEPGG